MFVKVQDLAERFKWDQFFSFVQLLCSDVLSYDEIWAFSDDLVLPSNLALILSYWYNLGNLDNFLRLGFFL